MYNLWPETVLKLDSQTAKSSTKHLLCFYFPGLFNNLSFNNKQFRQ